MNFAAFITNLKSDLTRFYAKESVLNNELLRKSIPRTRVNKGYPEEGDTEHRREKSNL